MYKISKAPVNEPLYWHENFRISTLNIDQKKTLQLAVDLVVCSSKPLLAFSLVNFPGMLFKGLYHMNNMWKRLIIGDPMQSRDLLHRCTY